jgi:hypothetical protein
MGHEGPDHHSAPSYQESTSGFQTNSAWVAGVRFCRKAVRSSFFFPMFPTPQRLNPSRLTFSPSALFSGHELCVRGAITMRERSGPFIPSRQGGKHMVTSLSAGDKIHIGNSVTLTLLAIEGNVVRFGVEASERGGRDHSVLIEGSAESDLAWWELN